MLDATRLLRHEHQTIMMMVHLIEDKGMELELSTSSSIMPSAINFFIRFMDRMHHAKEEHVLFPEVLRRHPVSQGLINELIEEHQHGREILQSLNKAVNRGDRANYRLALQEFTDYMRAHVAHEDEVLMPLVDELLNDDEQIGLADQLLQVQQERLSPEEFDQWAGYPENLASTMRAE